MYHLNKLKIGNFELQFKYVASECSHRLIPTPTYLIPIENNAITQYLVPCNSQLKAGCLILQLYQFYIDQSSVPASKEFRCFAPLTMLDLPKIIVPHHIIPVISVWIFKSMLSIFSKPLSLFYFM